jgi:hypothetical protein
MLLVLASYLYSPHALQAVPKAHPTEWLFLSVYPFYAAVMLFPYVNMRLRGYPVCNLVMMQGLLSITFPIYAISVLRGILKKVTFFEVMPKGISSKHFSIWKSPQTMIMIILFATGSLLTYRVVSVSWSSVACIALFGAYFYTISLGHYFVFVVEHRRLLKKRSYISELTSTPSATTHTIPAVSESMRHVEET